MNNLECDIQFGIYYKQLLTKDKRINRLLVDNKADKYTDYMNINEMM